MREIDFAAIDGIEVGHAENLTAATGCTVVICREGATAGVDVRGGAPGTRETDLLNPVNLVQKIFAVMLAGGSAFGLDAEAVASSTTPVPAPEIIKPVEKPVEIPAATYSPLGDAPINVAVFHFTPLSMDASHYGIAVTNALINTPKMQSTFIVLNRKDLEIFLAANNLQQSDQVDNMVEIGTRMGMNFIIAGNVIKRGSRIVTSYKVASVARRAVIYTNQFTSSGEAELSNNIAKMSDAIIATIQRSKY